MKKTYKSIKVFALLLCLATSGMKGQLSGQYTIDNGAPASPTNFQTFAAMLSVLNAPLLGVSGAVTVEVLGSMSYTEQLTFNQSNQISAINNIVINGNGRTVVFNATNVAQPWTIGFNGEDYVTVKDLNFVSSNSTNGMTGHLYNNADNNKFDNCTFTCQMNTTSSYNVPFSITGSANGITTAGLAGNNNTVTGCSMSGGYYGISMYGNTASPFSLNNQFINNNVRDYYAYGLYCAYAQNTMIKGNLFERPVVSTITTFYGVQLTTGAQGATVDGNRFRNPSGGLQPSTVGVYAIMISVSGTALQPINIRNNALYDLVSNGNYYLIYAGSYAYVNIVHNTIVADNPTCNYTGTHYMIYAYGNPMVVSNNIIFMRLGGTAQKWGYYCGATAGVTSNYNNIYNVQLGGTYNFGYWNSACANQAAMAIAGSNQQSKELDPMFLAPATGTFLPQNLQLNDMCTAQGTAFDITQTQGRSATTPDPGAWEFLNTPCSGLVPSSNLSPNQFNTCPNYQNGMLQFATNYTVNGLQFQWFASTTSSVGPFAPINNATLSILNTPTLGVTTWYQAVVTCTNGGAAATSGVAQYLVAGSTTNTVPYYENFEGIPLNNRLPNCSWAVSNANTALTYTIAGANNRIPLSGQKFASFYYSPAGQTFYYTNGIYMVPGITYSAGLNFISEAAANFTDLSILVGPNQNTTNQFSVASTGGPAISPVYKALGGLFTVNAPGFYYVAIRATAAGGAAQYLTWDDLSVTIPCGPGVNSPPMALTFNNAIVCAGTPLNITASGADTYQWNTGSTSPAITETPNVNTSYTVVGTATLSGCKTTLIQAFTVKPAPLVSAYGFPPISCAGKQVSLIGGGANTYTWSNNTQGPITNVAPISSQGYTVIGTGANLCTAKATVFITVNQNPVVQGAASTPFACSNEQVTFTGSGANTYQWVSGGTNLIMQGQNVTITAGQPGNWTYTVTGTDATGCQGIAQVNLTVDACTGLNKLSSATGINVYPNPTNGILTIAVNSASIKNIEVIDLTGRIVGTANGSSDSVELNLNNLSSGVYYVKVQTDASVEVVKVVKQ